ncbi:hypothetical protein phiPLPE_48 [Iodobacter phage PhiPLPE]|uniref:Uncharacterized protein n=1 Tax=Iodobacter phage PhiPLPE TaxID=551895 RepID=B5AX67_9CAUD|nr:hypothetical protein phiPLPE_48 [Iodobacter phage PhiPLPE]ACG60370.1 hypothetical protein phiPLPE_48 [Iodobacter phage PhiPLPE]
MSVIKTLCGYNVARASAVNQRKLLLIVGAHIAYASAKSKQVISIPMLKGALLSCSEENINEISNIVLWKAAKSGGSSSVTIDNFEDGMNVYFTLLAEAIAWNLGDFFSWLDSENGALSQTEPKAEAV